MGGSRKRNRDESRGILNADKTSQAQVFDLVPLPEAAQCGVKFCTTLYRDVDGYGTSKRRIAELRAQGRFEETDSLQYGEVDFEAFALLLWRVHIADRGVGRTPT